MKPITVKLPNAKDQFEAGMIVNFKGHKHLVRSTFSDYMILQRLHFLAVALINFKAKVRTIKTEVKFYLSTFTVEKLRDDLDYWIMIGIGDDIIRLSDSRNEYSHLVKKWMDQYADASAIPLFVLQDLQAECRKPVLLRPTFWRILIVKFQNIFR